MSNSKLSVATRRSVQILIASLAPLLAWAGPVDINKADAATIAVASRAERLGTEAAAGDVAVFYPRIVAAWATV